MARAPEKATGGAGPRALAYSLLVSLTERYMEKGATPEELDAYLRLSRELENAAPIDGLRKEVDDVKAAISILNSAVNIEEHFRQRQAQTMRQVKPWSRSKSDGS